MTTKTALSIYTNPITGSMVVGLADGPPLKKFKKGQEAEALAWAEYVPGWYISINRQTRKYSVDFVAHNGAQPTHHSEFYSEDEAKRYVYARDPKAIISIS